MKIEAEKGLQVSRRYCDYGAKGIICSYLIFKIADIEGIDLM